MAQLLASRYEVGPLLGAGGMARVVRGRDVRLDRPVAIKLVPADAIDPVGRERFGREAQSSARFAHPNAVMAFDAGESDGYLFLVMELVDGSSLAELLARRGPLSADEAIHVEDSILAALGAAHAAGIVHRDVKPGNVLLAEDGRVKLADFGIARRLDDLSSDLTGAGQFVGTPKYLAPEQIRGEPATPASDLYSAGVVLYEMLAGAPPFDELAPMELAWAHQHAAVPDLRVVRPDVPAAVASTIETALAKDPAERFATADAMRRALRVPAARAPTPPATAVFSAPVLPPTVIGPAPGTVAGEPVRRRPWRWALALALLVAVVGGAVALAISRRDDPSGQAQQGTATDAPTTVAATAPPSTAPPATTVPATTVPATTPPSTAAPETAPPPTSPPTTAALPVVPILPDTLPNLIDALAVAPELYGERTSELAADLADVEGRADRARRVLDRAEAWVQDGELEPALLPLLHTLLDGLANSDNSGPGNGNGSGNGGGGDDGRGEG